MLRWLLLVVAVPFAASACGAETPPARAATTSMTDAAMTAEPPPPPAPAPTSTASSGALPAAAPRTVRAPAYVIGGTGRRTPEWGPIFAPTQEKVAACVPGTSGVVTIRVENKGKMTLFTIDPNVSLDVQTRRCILEALSMIQLEEDVTKRLGPPGFTSHVVISW
jgi:hypothetical protein